MTLRAVSLLVLCCGALSACHGKQAEPRAHERRGPLVTAEQPPLPEDPAAGKRSEQQWARHLQAEEVERQMFFDRSRLAEHRALIARIQAARERLDQPKTPAELQRARAALQSSLQELQAGIDAVDRWKNSSHLLADYEALLKALSDSYPAARLAAMSGNKAPHDEARERFDRHLRDMNAWLARVDKDEDEAFEEAQ